MFPLRKGFMVGDRVRLAVPGFFFDYKARLGDEGVIVTQYGSMYVDPKEQIVWVKWVRGVGEGRIEGIMKKHLIKAPVG